MTEALDDRARELRCLPRSPWRGFLVKAWRWRTLLLAVAQAFRGEAERF
jgi:hypothetical protein